MTYFLIFCIFDTLAFGALILERLPLLGLVNSPPRPGTRQLEIILIAQSLLKLIELSNLKLKLKLIKLSNLKQVPTLLYPFLLTKTSIKALGHVLPFHTSLPPDQP